MKLCLPSTFFAVRFTAEVIFDLKAALIISYSSLISDEQVLLRAAASSGLASNW